MCRAMQYASTFLGVVGTRGLGLQTHFKMREYGCVQPHDTSTFLGGLGTWGVGASAPSHFKMREYNTPLPLMKNVYSDIKLSDSYDFEIATVFRFYKFKYHFSVYN